MNSTKTDEVKFCPFCGKSFKQAGNISFKFCPNCGQSLSVIFEEPDLGQATCDNTEPKEEISQLTTEKKTEKEKETETETEKATETKTEIEKEKELIPQNTLVAPDEAKYYSIVLKSCFNKENLGRRLEKVLVRNFSAISLALNNMPAVIVYKSKVDKMASVVEAFRKEQSAISIIPGNFDLYATIKDKCSNLPKLPQDVQEALLGAPQRLWLGDKIHLALKANTPSQEGVLAATDQGLYFLYNSGELIGYNWLILPYYRVKSVDYFEDETGCGISVSQKSKPGDIYPAPKIQKFYLPDSAKAKKMLSAAKLSLEAGAYLLKLFINCPKCGWHKTKAKSLNGGVNLEHCPKCNAEITLLLLENSN